MNTNLSQGVLIKKFGLINPRDWKAKEATYWVISLDEDALGENVFNRYTSKQAAILDAKKVQYYSELTVYKPHGRGYNSYIGSTN